MTPEEIEEIRERARIVLSSDGPYRAPFHAETIARLLTALEEAEARVEELEREMNAVEVMTRNVFFLPWWLRRVGPRCHEIARRALEREER